MCLFVHCGKSDPELSENKVMFSLKSSCAAKRSEIFLYLKKQQPKTKKL